MNDRQRIPRVLTRIAWALAVCFFGGCGPAQPLEPSSGRLDGGATAPVPAEVTVATVDRAAYDETIKSHRGRVVLVDFWATWCGPCMEQFAHTVEVAERHGGRGLTVVTVSLDDPAESEQIVEFLRSQRASGITNLVSQLGASPQSIASFEIANGAVPHYKLYDRRGQLRHSFGVNPKAGEQFTLADIDAAIEQLLAE